VIALIDYGAGNLTSVRKALHAVNADAQIPSDPSELDDARAVIVPGVGNFLATGAMSDRWRTAILGFAQHGRPLLGICLGLQWLFDGSTEAPDASGLSLISGCCDRLPGGKDLKIPHVGWNSLRFPKRSRLFEGVTEGSQVYFTHSYAAPITSETVAITTHGTSFASAVEKERVFGVQFHPEKSGEVGLRVLRNFLDAV
jgi:imidazole glycerol-phosphate synthase subunit HisH